MNFLKKTAALVWNSLPPVRRLKGQIATLNDQLLISERKKGHPFRLFESYEKAIEACTVSEAYQSHDLVSLVIEKQVAFNEALAKKVAFELSSASAFNQCALDYACSHLGKHSLRVLDFGGAAGAHYYNTMQLQGKRPLHDWVVVETPAMAKLASQNSALKDVQFYDSLDKVPTDPPFDLMLTSSALQYTSNPRSILRKLLTLTIPFLFFNRAAFTRGPRDVIGLQRFRLRENGHQIEGKFQDEDKIAELPFTYMSKSDFDAALTQDYRLSYSSPETSGHFMVGDEPIIGNAMMFERKKS